MPPTSNIDISLTGEYYVASMMHMHGWTGSLTLKNYPDIDIFGYDPIHNIHSNIQVKTGCNKYTVLAGPLMNNYTPQMIKGPFVFVHLLPNDSIECFILKAADVCSMVANNSYSPKSPIKFKWKDLLPYKNQWNNLW